ncbi:hypothetical protein HI914_06265 [Erysiphe necator]|nr:hypothetical protein HI914_06265 [Erysiphe necator]
MAKPSKPDHSGQVNPKLGKLGRICWITQRRASRLGIPISDGNHRKWESDSNLFHCLSFIKILTSVKILESYISRINTLPSSSFDSESQDPGIIEILLGIQNLSLKEKLSSIKMTENYSDYTLCGRFDGQKVTPSRWLTRLNMDLKKASLKKPEYFFEAIDILFEDKAANWLDTSPRWRKVVYDKENATERDVNDFKKAICTYFKSNQEQTDHNIHSDLRNLAQGPNEPLEKYYQRSLDILSRSHCRDEPLAESGDECLKPLKVVFLSGVITAFIEGIHYPELRSNVLFKASNTKKNELEQFREMYSQGRPVSATVARLGQQHYVEPERQYSLRNDLPSSQLYHGHINNYDRAPRYQTSNNYSNMQLMNQSLENKRPENQGSSQNPRHNDPKNYRGNDTKLLPPKNLSRNPYVNGSRSWNQSLKPLCIRCGTVGHASPKCGSHANSLLENWEQAYLKEMVFSMDASMCMLQINDSHPQSVGKDYRELNTWRENMTPQVEELGFEDFGRTKSQECVIGFNDENRKSTQVDSNCITGEGSSYQDETSVESDALNNFCKLSKLAAYLNEGEKPRKHGRVDIEDFLNQDQPIPKSAKKAYRRGQRALQHLREIVGRSGKGPINYTKLAEEIRVNVSLLDLFQMSPELSRAFRNLSTRIVQKRGTKGPKVNSIAVDHEMRNNESSSLNNIISYVNMEERAFCVPAVIRTRKDGKFVDVKLPPSVAQADTGSEMVVISYGLIKYLSLPMKLLSENGFSGLTMNVANGTSSPHKYFTSFQINVLGISRHVEAFVRPWNSSNEQEFHLLLGLPWLHDANAKIYIRDSIIKIGDPNRSEKIVQIQGPEFTQSSYHKLILHPKQPKNRNPRSNCSESSSDDGDDSDYDFDSDISLDENLFEDNKPGQESKKTSVHFANSYSKK